MVDVATYDYVIVGAGSAGCVLANRLTEDPRTSVLLVEVGGSERHPFISMPAGFIKTVDNPLFNWCFHTEPSATVKDRAILFPRGKVLGGSSAINGHLYVRGQPRDYDTWAQLGNRGWSYDEVLPYFRKSETRPGGDIGIRGQDGPLHVSDIHERHPLCEAFFEAAQVQGLPHNPDYNSGNQEGTAYYQRTIRNGRRWSAAHAFLRPAIKRPNLTVLTDTFVETITFDCHRATGLRCRWHGQERTVNAAREVILAAGAIGTPHLLQVSGAGPAEHLRQIGIKPRFDLAGVGEGLQDHYAVRVAARVKDQATLNERARGLRLGFEIAKWFMIGKGLLAFSPAHAAAFVRSEPHLETPDLQFVFTPASYTEGMIGQLQSFPGMTMGVWQLRPESRGYVRALSPDPYEAPTIQPNYLETKADQEAIVRGLKWCRRFLSSEPLSSFSAGETLPGPDTASDENLLDYARERGATVYHAVSTCRMGTDDRAVVDHRLRVKGIDRLRIIDASVMPTMPSANTNAATMMIAEKGADLLNEDRN